MGCSAEVSSEQEGKGANRTEREGVCFLKGDREHAHRESAWPIVALATVSHLDCCH